MRFLKQNICGGTETTHVVEEKGESGCGCEHSDTVAGGFCVWSSGSKGKETEARIGSSAEHSTQGQPACYLGARGLRGPQVRSAGGDTCPATS